MTNQLNKHLLDQRSTHADGEPPGPLLMIYEVQDINEAISLHNQ